MKPTAHNRIGQFLAAVIVLLALYILLIPPAAWLFDHSTPEVQQFIAWMYYPVDMLPDNTVGRFLGRYVNLLR